MAQKLKIVAHRCGMKAAPENTMTALRKALAAGVAAVEFDVRSTRDGEIVLRHDPRIMFPSAKKGPISHVTYQELLGTDVGGGESPPRLKDVLTVLAEHNRDLPDGRKIRAYIEVKRDDRSDVTIKADLPLAANSDTLAQCLKDAHEQHGARYEDMLLMSRNNRAIADIKAQNPQFRTAFLNYPLNGKKLLKAKNAGFDHVYTYHQTLTSKHVFFAHTYGMDVCAGGINKGTDAARLMKYLGNADYFSTNDVGAAQHFLQSYVPKYTRTSEQLAALWCEVRPILQKFRRMENHEPIGEHTLSVIKSRQHQGLQQGA